MDGVSIEDKDLSEPVSTIVDNYVIDGIGSGGIEDSVVDVESDKNDKLVKAEAICDAKNENANLSEAMDDAVNEKKQAHVPRSIA